MHFLLPTLVKEMVNICFQNYFLRPLRHYVFKLRNCRKNKMVSILITKDLLAGGAKY